MAGWCLAVSLGGSGRVVVVSLSSHGGSREACDGLWGLVGAGWCLAVSLRMFGSTRGLSCGDSLWLVGARDGSWRLGGASRSPWGARVDSRLSSRVGLVEGSRLAGASRFLGGRVDSQSLAVTPGGLRQLAAASRGLWWVGAAAAGALELIAVEARYWDETVCMSCLLVLHIVYEQRALACLHRLHY